MPAKEQLAEQLGETYGYLSEMFDHKIEEVKLSVAEKSALTVSKVITAVIMVVLGLIMAIFGLIALAFYLAGDMDVVRGFGIVALVLLLLLLIVFFLRRYIIVNPTVSRVIAVFFSENKNSPRE